MARQRKVVRTKTLYKKRRIPKNALARILFVVLIIILIGIGYLVMREWSARFGKDADKNISSSNPSSNIQNSSVPESEVVSSQPEVLPTIKLGKMAQISADTLLATGFDITSELAKVKAQGNTAIVIELKAENGMLAYQSKNEMAIAYGAISENAIDLAEISKAIIDAGLIPFASISTLKDAKAPHVSNENSYAYGTSLETNWLDNSVAKGGRPWLNPYMDNTRNYICGISKEISDAGFSTILLDHVMFPDKNTGKMNTIKTSPDRNDILNQLVTEVQAAVPNATVIRTIDVVSTAINSENGFASVINTITTKTIGLEINLDVIEANKQKICVQNGIVEQNGYDKTITAATVAGHIIEQAKSNGANQVVPIVSSKDLAQLEQVFKDKGITNYLVI